MGKRNTVSSGGIGEFLTECMKCNQQLAKTLKKLVQHQATAIIILERCIFCTKNFDQHNHFAMSHSFIRGNTMDDEEDKLLFN